MKAKPWLIGCLFFSTLILQVHTQQRRVHHFPQRHLGTQQLQIANFSTTPPEQAPAYAGDHILVKFNPMVSPQSIRDTLDTYNIPSYRYIPVVDLYRVDIPPGTSVEEMIYVWSQNAWVEEARPDFTARIAVTPNDEFFNRQYALSNTGQQIPVPGSPTGKASADISATTAWEETKGNENVVIAVIDTGVDLNHIDLKNKIVSPGRDFVNDDFDATDDNGHGTFVAAIAAAETNNNEGIAGVAWACKILPVKTMDEEGDGFYSDVIDGIIWAVDNGAHVINLSLGGGEPDTALEQAVTYAVQNGAVVVAASGNDSGAGVLYPAKYDQWTLAVAATDFNDIRPEWSNYGPEVDVAAPGEYIISAVPTWFFGPGSIPYGIGGGTSYSTPHVAGMAALIISHKPWLLGIDPSTAPWIPNPAQASTGVQNIMKIIRYTSEDVNSSDHPGQDEFIGYGRINLATALVPIQIKN
jgi:subtilisin family serine protease